MNLKRAEVLYLHVQNVHGVNQASAFKKKKNVSYIQKTKKNIICMRLNQIHVQNSQRINKDSAIAHFTKNAHSHVPKNANFNIHSLLGFKKPHGFICARAKFAWGYIPH